MTDTTEPTSLTEAAFRKFEAECLDEWDGIEPFPDRLAIFRAGWDAAFNHFVDGGNGE